MSYTLKDIYLKLRNDIPSLAPYDVYEAWNNAIDFLNSKNFMVEAINTLSISTAGVGDLTSLTNDVKRLIRVMDSDGYSLTSVGNNKEYIDKFAGDNEKVYAQIGNDIYVKPLGTTEISDIANQPLITNLIQFIAADYFKYTGDVTDFWEKHFIGIGTTIISTGATDAANNDTWNVADVEDEEYTGTHTGTDGADVLLDGSAAFPAYSDLTGETIYNLTKNISGVIVSNTATTILVEFWEGMDAGASPWDNGDRYQVSVNTGNILEMTEQTMADEAAGDTITITRSTYVYKVVVYEGLSRVASFTDSVTVTVDEGLIPVIKYYALYDLYRKRGELEKSKDCFSIYEKELSLALESKKMFKEVG